MSSGEEWCFWADDSETWTQVGVGPRYQDAAAMAQWAEEYWRMFGEGETWVIGSKVVGVSCYVGIFTYEWRIPTD